MLKVTKKILIKPRVTHIKTLMSQDVERVGMTMDVKHDPNVKHDVTLWILDQLIQGI